MTVRLGVIGSGEMERWYHFERTLGPKAGLLLAPQRNSRIHARRAPYWRAACQ